MGNNAIRQKVNLGTLQGLLPAMPSFIRVGGCPRPTADHHSFQCCLIPLELSHFQRIDGVDEGSMNLDGGKCIVISRSPT